jgi:hypothetical protein
MFLEDEKYFDSDDDNMIIEMWIESNFNLTTTAIKVADYYDIYSDNKTIPSELRQYIFNVTNEEGID